MTSLTSKRTVSLLVAVPALVVLLGASRTWLTGRTTEPLVGGGTVSATGSQLSPGVVALGLVCLAALVAMLTGGTRVRRTASVVTVLAAGGAAALVVGVLTDRSGALGRVAATGLGRTGTVQTTAEPTGWLWMTLVASVLLVATSLMSVVAAGRWAGLSARFESPTDPLGGPSAGAAGPDDSTAAAPAGRGARRSAWDEMSEGRDPTVSSGVLPDPADERDVAHGRDDRQAPTTRGEPT